MGCSESKTKAQILATPFKLTDLDKKKIYDNALSIVMTNAALRCSATNCAARFQGERTAKGVLCDSHPMAYYFPSGDIPYEIGAGDKSVAQTLESVKQIAFENITGVLGPELEKKFPALKLDVPMQKAARTAIRSENDAAVERVAMELVDRILAGALRPVVPHRDITVTVPETVNGKVEKDTTETRDVVQSKSPARGRSDDGNIGGDVPRSQTPPRHHVAPAGSDYRRARPQAEFEEGVLLPKGEWVKVEGTPYYFSAQENLYYHPPSSQFYDPSNVMWYDPDKDEWYNDETDGFE